MGLGAGPSAEGGQPPRRERGLFLTLASCVDPVCQDDERAGLEPLQKPRPGRGCPPGPDFSQDSKPAHPVAFCPQNPFGTQSNIFICFAENVRGGCAPPARCLWSPGVEPVAAFVFWTLISGLRRVLAEGSFQRKGVKSVPQRLTMASSVPSADSCSQRTLGLLGQLALGRSDAPAGGWRNGKAAAGAAAARDSLEAGRLGASRPVNQMTPFLVWV